MFKKTIVTTLLSSAVLLADSGVGININEDDLEIEAVLDSRNLEALQTSSTIYQADVNFLRADTEKLIGLGIGATNNLEAAEGVEVTLGAKFIWAEVGSDDFSAMPLMAKVRYTFPPLEFGIPPISLEASGLYAPSALSFSDSESYSEYRISGDIEVIENVKIYAGYRNIHTEYKGYSRDLFDTGYYAGLKITY
ncbi:MAG: Unknown protein [uncultured Sulfurovum sp.]|uniref:Outer membrane protein beta-barrel domain-containing protein n=1 Tax=uncultured Sulfurovum sp. TaxID=269237 RepID=A0A6S6T431_9BACT|nr:MAG: Unknown protein [uncultured Sulfurovum sp.]